MRRIYVSLSVLIFLFFVWQIWKDHNRPYLPYQEKFLTLLAKEGEGVPELRAFRIGTRQRWLEKLARVDRCETCHLGVEDLRFKDAGQPYASHPDPDVHPFESFGCTVCHGGQGLATSREDAHGPTENWNEATYHKNFIEKSCSLCHGENAGKAAPVLARGRALFYELGCRGCHKVEGKKRVKVGPPIRKIGNKVRVDWLYRWLLNPKQEIPNARMPNFFFSGQDAADIARFLVPRPPERMTTVAGSYDRGKKILGESRCTSCHPFEGRGGDIGPDLAKIGSKVHSEWLLKWLEDPQGLLPATKMPDYGFSGQEARDLTAFLMEEYIDLELEEDQVAETIRRIETGDVNRGKELVEKHGCTGCHDIEGVEDRGENGSDLTRIGDIHISRLEFGRIEVPRKDRTVPNWLYNKMKNARLFKEDLKMPDYSFTDEQAEAVTTYLLSLTGRRVPPPYTLPLGEPPPEYDPQGEFGKVLSRYRCLVCHRIRGKGGTLAPDLTQEGSRVRKDWFRRYMKIPYAIRPILVERMPRFKIKDEEIDTLYSYIRATLVNDRAEGLSEAVRKIPLSDPGLIREGRRLFFEKYACDACHQINLTGGTIGPDLTGGGDRYRPEWIVQYLRNPKAFLERSVEPVHDLTEKEVEALAAFVLSPKKAGEGP
jgi:mono/diheme cytochrome c family protein